MVADLRNYDICVYMHLSGYSFCAHSNPVLGEVSLLSGLCVQHKCSETVVIDDSATLWGLGGGIYNVSIALCWGASEQSGSGWYTKQLSNRYAQKSLSNLSETIVKLVHISHQICSKQFSHAHILSSTHARQLQTHIRHAQPIYSIRSTLFGINTFHHEVIISQCIIYNIPMWTKFNGSGAGVFI